MFWDQRPSDIQEGYSNAELADRFIRITDAQVVDRGQRVSKESYISTGTINDPFARETVAQTEYTHTLVISDMRMAQVTNAIERLDRAERDARSAHDTLDGINQENREFHEFMGQHPELGEKYRELMTMCKLAGLRNIPQKLNYV